MNTNKIQAKKTLGQHFLRSEKALRQILEDIDKNFSKKNWVFEIGPGEGVLTEKLLEAGYKVCAVEIDKEAIAYLERFFEKEIESGQLRILEKNCLDVNYNVELIKLESNTSTETKLEYILIGNIPYYITGAIFRKTFEQKILPKQAIFLVQKEVADRVVARDKKETVLSVSVKIFGEAKYIDTVYAGSFSPPPKVDSAILSINNIRNPFEKSRMDYKTFFEIVKAAFSQKRKKMISNLKNNLEEKTWEKYKDLISEIFINKYGENVRAEDVSIEDWKEIIK